MLKFEDVAAVRRFVDKEGIEFVSFFVSDIDGRFRNVTIPAANFTEKTVTEGIGIDASSLGFAAVERSDMLIKPDLSFAFLDPVEPDAKVLYFICDILDIGTEANFNQDLRHIVWKAVDALKAEGVADEVRIGLELEFYVLDELHSTMTTRETSYRVESGELASPPGGAELYRIYSNRGYFRSEPNDHHFALRNEICRGLQADRARGEVPPPRGRQFAVRDRVQVPARSSSWPTPPRWPNTSATAWPASTARSSPSSPS